MRHAGVPAGTRVCPQRVRRQVGALARLLVGTYRLSKRLVKDALSDMLGVDLSVGSVVNLEGEMTDALAPAVAEARLYVQAAGKSHADETGWGEGRNQGRGHRAWRHRADE
ncbi:hypothetical protein MVI01_01120 [Myxococcus virescens]|uniref:Transposase IS66 family protein n=1 Tax=Myxococcus virescens TaxID=83456 RepID=A0A511H464_9BACT|nr:hypothetical protein MVI01_01120 [Myxococcus virescens]SDE29477.1 Transposase IS66 family protein [Myxococcus virescens]